MKKILVYFMLLMPMIAHADTCIECPGCENMIRIEKKSDEGYSWKCKRCKWSNWKQYPPLTCGNCGCHIGQN